MATTILKSTIENFETWKQAFDAGEPTRRKHGILGHRVLRDPLNAHTVVLVARWPSLESARALMQDPELRASMANAGIKGPPEMWFLDDAEEQTF